MALQSEQDLNNNPFILSGVSYVKNGITLAQDAGRAAVLAIYTVMGKIAATIPTTGTADGGNTGDGTVTAVAHGAGDSPIVGTWVLTNTATVVNGGVWKLTDPQGTIVATELVMQVGAGAATRFNAGGIDFTITDGATDFAATDFFTIAVTANGQWVPWLPSLVNGGEIPAGILMVDDVTAAALVAGTVTDQTILVGGCMTIDSTQVILDDGVSTINTALAGGDTVADALAKLGIFTEQTVDIASYET